MLEHWIDELSDQAIQQAVGAESYRRGAVYARQGRVDDLNIAPGGRALLATVRGTGSSPYYTVVTSENGPTGAVVGWSGQCTCPIGWDCKHVAAVALAAREALGNRRAARGGSDLARVAGWERSIGELVRAPEQAGAGIPIALQFEVEPAPRQPARRIGPASGTTPRSRIRIRPVVPGKNGAWIRTGISWAGLEYDYGRTRRVPAHRDALLQLHAAHVTGSRSHYSYGDVPVHLDDFGPALWPLLQQAVEAGVALVPARGATGSITLSPAPAKVALDLRRAGPADDAVLEPVVCLGDGVRTAASATFVGEPVHGVVVERRNLAPDQESGLLLAPLAERASEQVSRLLREGRRVDIPATDLDRFLRDFYPGLAQVVAVRSSDRTVVLPEIAPPRLELLVSHAPGHRVRIEWSVGYPMGDDVRRFALRDDAQSTTARDRAREGRLQRELDLPDDRLPQLRGSGPDRLLVPVVELHGMDAVRFTEDVLPALLDRDDVDVEVVGPAPDYRHAEAAPLIRVSATDGEDGDWFDLGVTVSVDGEEIPFQALFVGLARGDSHLVLDSGTYFGLDRPEFVQLRRLIEEARGLVDHPTDTLTISRYQAGLWEELVELGVVEAQSERWARSVGGLLELDDLPSPTPPAGLAAELRPYQLDGYRWLRFLWDHQLGGILADDMGLGKTLQALALVLDAQQAGELTAPVLVVAPTSVVSNWAAEATRFAPGLRVVTVAETDGKRATALAEHVAGADLVITSYALFRIDEEVYGSLPWRGLILDEAQFVKNHQAKTYQCARRLTAPFKLAITGTPLENSLMDLWSLLSIVAPGLFPSPQRFTDFYRKPIERGTDPELLSTLRRRIRPLLRRRTKEQVATELPPKQEQVLEVALNPRHQKIYQTHLQRERTKVLGMVDDLDRNRFAIFRSLTLLRQLSLDPALVDEQYAGVRASKVDVLLEQLQDVIGGGHRALVFSQFTGFLRTVRDRLDADGVPYTYLDGQTRNRGQRIAEFKSGTAPVFLISLKAGGFGLNLTEADYVFVLDPWWNPAVEAQAVDRTHRIGQDKTVMVYRLVATDTIEEKVMALKARKADLFARVMDDGGQLAAPLTADDIRGLFAT